jgi:hypothetical protein
VVNFAKAYVKDSFDKNDFDGIKVILMVKKLDDNNLLPTFKKKSQFKKYGI